MLAILVLFFLIVPVTTPLVSANPVPYTSPLRIHFLLIVACSLMAGFSIVAYYGFKRSKKLRKKKIAG
jgi:hypothetical protein